jgi:hypothetical protein
VNLNGHWHNAEVNKGWTLTFSHNEKTWLGTKPIFIFTLNPKTPLQWHTEDGLVLEPCRRSPICCVDEDGFPTDGGSVPWVITFCIDPLLCPASYCMHNVGYQAGYEWAVEDGKTYKIYLSRSEQDELLHWRCQTPPEMATSGKADVIWAGVRAGGWRPWMKYRKQDKSESTK